MLVLPHLNAQTVPPPVAISSTSGVHPNLSGHMEKALRYRPDAGDFVIENGTEFFNRSLYGGNTAFRVEGGDKPEFVMYLPGRGGNLRLAVRVRSSVEWLKDASRIVTRYRPGELIYEISDPAFGPGGSLQISLLAYARTEGLIVRAVARNMGEGAELIWAYGGVNGERGARDGDIGTEKVPISQYFQFLPRFADGNAFELGAETFSLKAPHTTIVGVSPAGASQHLADAEDWNDLPALLSKHPASPPKRAVIVGRVRFPTGHPLYLSLQKIDSGPEAVSDLDTYREVTARTGSDAEKMPRASLPAAFDRVHLPQLFTETEGYFDSLRTRVRIETPDPYLDAAVGALDVVADALWDSDAHAIMHGSIAWRTKLLGWRGPYALDDLGWHDRARQNFNTWLSHQNTSPIPAAVPSADPKANLARNEPGLHSNGDLSNSHYDMNMVFVDALFRHLLWTGDRAYARTIWPVLQRHMAWEKRLFRREYGPEKLPLYEAYATIWASDDLYYNGGGSAYASAYNVYANRMTARIALMIGEDPRPYAQEAERIETAMHSLLWMPDKGTFAEYKDYLGEQLVHADYGLWNFYHTVDEGTVTAREAWQMGEAMKAHFRPIPVSGPGVPADRPYHVLSETDWMPYSWSINNVVMDENMHAALALWESGHAEDAYVLAKSSLLASMYMGIAPGNLGTMSYLDVYRRESQRDFGDSAGVMSRAVIEGLFGVHPDALAETLTIAPGFPADWTHARLVHPDLVVSFARSGQTETWTVAQTGARFHKLRLRLPAAFAGIEQVEVNDAKSPWHTDPDAAGRPIVEVETSAGIETRVRIRWSGQALQRKTLDTATIVDESGEFRRMSLGAFRWWSLTARTSNPEPFAARPFDWRTPRSSAAWENIPLTSRFNDRVDAIFAFRKFLSPRSPGVSLSLPWQGAGAWAGHLNELPRIDDNGLRRLAGAHNGNIIMPNGVSFRTPSESGVNNIAFTSRWDNYPREILVPLSGRARHAYFLMAGSTNFMQSRIDNGEVVVGYTDGTSSRLALRNPETWWPIEQDYFIDDYQFPFVGPLPPRIDLQTGRIRLLDPVTFKGQGGAVPGGAATVLELELDPERELQSLTVRTLCNDVVIGLMSATLERLDARGEP